MDAHDIIEKLNLSPLPQEGGYFKETFRDNADGQNYSTSIYYLITPQSFSKIHAVKSSEVFHFYCGDPVKMIQITPQGNLTEVILGNHLEKNEKPQVVVPAKTWQGTMLLPGGSWALLGCTVAPGFNFSDYIHGNPEELYCEFPQHKDLIKSYI